MERDANELADNLGVKIFTADIIYHLFDSFTKYQVIVMIIIVILLICLTINKIVDRTIISKGFTFLIK